MTLGGYITIWGFNRVHSWWEIPEIEFKDLCCCLQDSDDDDMSDDIATMGELSDDSDSDDSDTQSLASSVAELSSGMPLL